jgi:6-phosphogluconolactonase
VAHIARVDHLLLVSNRGHDSVCVFRIDESSGHLSYVRTVPSGGAEPRHFVVLDRRWLLVANQSSNLLCAYRVDHLEGERAPTLCHSVSVPTPVCIAPVCL